jgi:phosphopantothenoylcysteine synthetase/decarboxylase
MRAIVTCGPGYEPIDSVRRLTNLSTGELGLLLSAALARAGHEVVCMKGEGATSCIDPAGAEVIVFSTNGDLLRRLEGLPGRGNVGALFHVAALCDYRVGSVRAADGTPLSAAKLPTRAGNLTLTLEPAVKVLPKLRGLFPAAKIAGWKLELDGSREDALAMARRQLAECESDACVLNGPAWGAGFGFVEPGREPVAIADKPALCEFLAGWIAGRGK